MKNLVKVLILSAVIGLLSIAHSNAQTIVRAIPPHKSAPTKPHRPSPKYVWVSEEWTPFQHTYSYVPGYWAIPPRRGLVWLSGHWVKHTEGYIWMPGYWK